MDSADWSNGTDAMYSNPDPTLRLSVSVVPFHPFHPTSTQLPPNIHPTCTQCGATPPSIHESRAPHCGGYWMECHHTDVYVGRNGTILTSSWVEWQRTDVDVGWIGTMLTWMLGRMTPH